MEGLSNQQQNVFDFIERYRSEQGISPSIADIADGLGLGHTTAATYVEALKRKGRVTSISRVPRSLRTLSANATAKALGKQ